MLIGEMAVEAGYLASLSFLVATVVTAITALPFAELSSRFPLSGGSPARRECSVYRRLCRRWAASEFWVSGCGILFAGCCGRLAS